MAMPLFFKTPLFAAGLVSVSAATLLSGAAYYKNYSPHENKDTIIQMGFSQDPMALKEIVENINVVKDAFDLFMNMPLENEKSLFKKPLPAPKNASGSPLLADRKAARGGDAFVITTVGVQSEQLKKLTEITNKDSSSDHPLPFSKASYPNEENPSEDQPLKEDAPANTPEELIESSALDVAENVSTLDVAENVSALNVDENVSTLLIEDKLYKKINHEVAVKKFISPLLVIDKLKSKAREANNCLRFDKKKDNLPGLKNEAVIAVLSSWLNPESILSLPQVQEKLEALSPNLRELVENHIAHIKPSDNYSNHFKVITEKSKNSSEKLQSLKKYENTLKTKVQQLEQDIDYFRASPDLEGTEKYYYKHYNALEDTERAIGAVDTQKRIEWLEKRLNEHPTKQKIINTTKSELNKIALASYNFIRSEFEKLNEADQTILLSNKIYNFMLNEAYVHDADYLSVDFNNFSQRGLLAVYYKMISQNIKADDPQHPKRASFFARLSEQVLNLFDVRSIVNKLNVQVILTPYRPLLNYESFPFLEKKKTEHLLNSLKPPALNRFLEDQYKAVKEKFEQLPEADKKRLSSSDSKGFSPTHAVIFNDFPADEKEFEKWTNGLSMNHLTDQEQLAFRYRVENDQQKLRIVTKNRSNQWEILIEKTSKFYKELLNAENKTVTYKYNEAVFVHDAPFMLLDGRKRHDADRKIILAEQPARAPKQKGKLASAWEKAANEKNQEVIKKPVDLPEGFSLGGLRDKLIENHPDYRGAKAVKKKAEAVAAPVFAPPAPPPPPPFLPPPPPPAPKAPPPPPAGAAASPNSGAAVGGDRNALFDQVRKGFVLKKVKPEQAPVKILKEENNVVSLDELLNFLSDVASIEWQLNEQEGQINLLQSQWGKGYDNKNLLVSNDPVKNEGANKIMSTEEQIVLQAQLNQELAILALKNDQQDGKRIDAILNQLEAVDKELEVFSKEKAQSQKKKFNKALFPVRKILLDQVIEFYNQDNQKALLDVINVSPSKDSYTFIKLLSLTPNQIGSQSALIKDMGLPQNILVNMALQATVGDVKLKDNQEKINSIYESIKDYENRIMTHMNSLYLDKINHLRHDIIKLALHSEGAAHEKNRQNLLWAFDFLDSSPLDKKYTADDWEVLEQLPAPFICAVYGHVNSPHHYLLPTSIDKLNFLNKLDRVYENKGLAQIAVDIEELLKTSTDLDAITGIPLTKGRLVKDALQDELDKQSRVMEISVRRYKAGMAKKGQPAENGEREDNPKEARPVSNKLKNFLARIRAGSGAEKDMKDRHVLELKSKVNGAGGAPLVMAPPPPPPGPPPPPPPPPPGAAVGVKKPEIDKNEIFNSIKNFGVGGGLKKTNRPKNEFGEFI